MWSKRSPSPDFGYSEVTDGATIYPALSGLDSFRFHPHGVAMNQSLVPRHGTRQALGWYISPRWGFSDRVRAKGEGN
jgi:hypothetical protein